MSATTTATGSGIGLAGAHVVCESSAAGLTTSVQINWNGDGVTFTEEKDHMNAFSFTRGRSTSNDVFTAGRATVKLRNNDGRYSPFNPLSPLYGQVVANRAIKLVATYHGVSYPQFAGTLVEPDQSVVPTYSEVNFQCLDAFERFRLAIAAAGIQLNQRVDQIIAAILTAAGWTGSTRLDAGSTLPVFTQTTTSVLSALQDAANQEVGGRIYMGADGAVVFENAAHRRTAPAYQAFTGVDIAQLDLTQRQSDLYGLIAVAYASYVWGAAGTSIYSGQAGLPLYPGANTITDYYGTLGATNVIVPTQSNDYTVLDQQSPPVYPLPGTAIWPVDAVDVTANVSVQAFTENGAQFTLVLYNSLPYTVFLQTLQIRGTGQTQQSSPRQFRLNPGGTSLASGQTLTKTFDFVTDDARVSAWAQQKIAALATQHPRPVITLIGKSPALIHEILGLDLSSRLWIHDTGTGAAIAAAKGGTPFMFLLPGVEGLNQPWHSGLDGQFFIEQITTTITAPGIVTAQITLFDLAQGIG